MIKQSYLAIVGLAILFTAGCGTNKKSGRDVRREQIRNNAEAKRDELKKVEGKYFGQLLRDSGYDQSVTLNLEIKDVPQEEEGEIDPIMIPTLTGYIKFNYGNLANDEEQYISFGISNAEFDPKTESLDFVVTNETYKNLLIKVTRYGDELKGKWSAPDVSQSGEIVLLKAVESGGKAQLADIPAHGLDGEYRGYLSWDSRSLYQYATLTFNSTFSPPDNIDLDATARLYFGGKESLEYLTYSLSDVQFNPINGSITIKGENSEVSFQGRLVSGKLSGKWSSKYLGTVGGFNFQRTGDPKVPSGLKLFKTLRDTYYGTLASTHPQSEFPERILFSIITSEDASQPNGIKISGNVRFYIGTFGSLEYFELPFSDVSFNFYTRQLVAKTSGDYNLTIKGLVSQTGIDGKLFYDALGEVGNIETVRGTPEANGEEVGGEYRGYLAWDAQSAYQHATITLVTSYDNGLKISASAKLIFGTADSSEYLTYQFDRVEFNPTTSQITLKGESNDVSFVGKLIDGKITGSWHTDYTGKVGGFALAKSTSPTPPEGLRLFSELKGTYQGRLTNTNSDSNLPERFQVSFITRRDLSQPSGIKITGNIRFYLGPFSSLEYVERGLSEIRFNFFTRELIASTAGEDKYTLVGRVGSDKLMGVLSHDALGEIANVEVSKQ